MQELAMSEVDVAAALAAGLVVWEVMGEAGDIKRTWDLNDLTEVIKARNEFERMIQSGHRAYHLKPDGTQGAPMPTFDTKAGRVLFVPQMVGG